MWDYFGAITTNDAGDSSQIPGDAPAGYWHFD
jgi:hypothetical protein